MRVIISVKRYVFSVKYTVAELRHTYLGKVEPRVSRIELLASAVFVIQLGKLGKSLEGGKLICGCARCGSKLVKESLVDVEHLGGFCNGKYVQSAVRKSAFLNECVYVCRKLVLGEIVIEVDEHTLFIKLHSYLRISRKDVGHIGGAGISVCDHSEAFVKLGA